MSNQPLHPTATGDSRRSHDSVLSSPLLDNAANTTVGAVNDPETADNIHFDSPPFIEEEGSTYLASPKLKAILLTILSLLIYALIGFVLLGCATFIPEKRMPKPWNFPKADEWNKPLEFSWDNAVANWKNLTSPRKKTIHGVEYEYDEVTQLYFPNLMKLAKKPKTKEEQK